MSGHGDGRVRPGPDGRHDDLVPDELEGLTLDVPDDPRELAADLDRWAAESQPDTAARRTPDPIHDRQGARRRRLAITAGVVLVSMVIVALSGAIGAWIVAPQAAPPAAAPLANAITEPGRVGGLLPEAPLQRDGATVSSRSLRPAVLVLVPGRCPDCPELLAQLAPQVVSFGITLAAVGTDEGQLAALEESTGPTRLVGLTDPGDVIRGAYGLAGITLLLVRDDGVVVDVVHEPAPDARIDGALVDLVPVSGQST